MVVDDALIVTEMLAYPVGPERDQYVLTALRIGVLALKQAQGRLDADVAANSRIVVEAKQDASYGLAHALSENEQARKNRQAEVGVFVFSKRTANAQIVPFGRYGND